MPRCTPSARVCDAQHGLVDLVRQDLVRDLRRPHTGREGLTAEQTLRAYVVKQVKDWDLRELRDRTADGLTLRAFTRFFSAPVPTHKAFHRAFCRLRPETVRALNEPWCAAPWRRGWRTATGSAPIPPSWRRTSTSRPTRACCGMGCACSRASWASCRPCAPSLAIPFVNHTRRARRRMQEIARLTPTQRATQQVPKYRALITLTTTVLAAARAVASAARAAPGPDPLTGIQVDALATEITTYGERIDHVIAQARRRVLQGETVPTADKLFSIFEPHTDLIKRGKAQRPVEFGHKVLLSESGHGLITDYRVLDGNPTDDHHVAPSLAHHLALFGGPPTLAACDRGFYSVEALAACQAAGVTTACIPQRGGRKTPARAAHEKSRAFRLGQRFRAGIEGRISCSFAGGG